MKLSGVVSKGAIWTLASYASNQGLRFLTNVVLTRILAPELFGLMVIVNTVRTAISLFTDVGTGQNVIVNPLAEEPEFYNTAWTINLIRGCSLSVLCFIVAKPLASLYGVPEISAIFPVMGMFFVTEGFAAMSRPLVQRRLQFGRLNVFDIIFDAISFLFQIVLALISPTVWSLVFGALFSSAARTIGSYNLVPGLRHRLFLSKRHVWEIFHFSKWLFVSSIAFFLAMNFDRLYLAKMLPLDIVGVYGLARSLAEPLNTLVVRLSNLIVFPVIASSTNQSRETIRAQLATTRIVFLLLAATGLSLFVAGADLLVSLLYDKRYHAAGWMASLLVLGVWPAVLCNINESVMLGLSKPSYNAIGFGLKLVWLIVGLPLAFGRYGMFGAILVISIGDLVRYPVVFWGQVRARFSFGVQDVLATVLFVALILSWEWLRSTMGWGSSFRDL
jgi:O-antigen/teichoic acid export membrane protein